MDDSDELEEVLPLPGPRLRISTPAAADGRLSGDPVTVSLDDLTAEAIGLRKPPSPERDRPPRRLVTSIAVIDERRLIVDALAALLRASDGFAVTTFATRDPEPAAIIAAGPDVVLVGMGDEHDEPMRLLAGLHALAPATRTVIVADAQDPDLIRCVLEQGVAALVLTATSGADLAIILDQVLRGQTALPAGWQKVLAASDRDPVAGLSERQLQVLRMLADGYTYEEISERLIITVNTVKFHVRSIYLRLGVGNRMAAARALEAGLVRHAHPISLGRSHQSR